jgi:hypothetical protein
MRKLFLTSFSFRTGDSEFKEYRIVVVNNYDKPKNKSRELSDETQVALEKLTTWFSNEFPESKMLGAWVHEAIDEVQAKQERLTGEVKPDRRKDKIEDDHTLNDIIFEAYSEKRGFYAEGHDLWVLGSITGQEVEGEMKWGWIWQVFSQSDEQVFKYTIDMKDERLSKSSEDVVDYLNECFKEMVEMVKHDIVKGIIKI